MDKEVIQQKNAEPRKIPKRLAGETLHCYFSLVRTYYDTTGRCVITFDDRVDAARMARAVRLTLDAEPILGCRLVEHPWRLYWERRDDLDQIPIFSIAVPHDLDRDLDQFMGASLDPTKDPQVQTCLFRGDRDTLCIKINHMIADAGGLLEYASLLAGTFRQLGQNPDYVPAPRLDDHCGQAEVLNQVGFWNLIQAIRHFSLPPGTWNKQTPSQDLDRRKFLIRRIEPERLARIKNYAHHCQIPLNHILLTAYYRALFHINNPPLGVPLSTQVTMSLRRYLKAGSPRSITNLVGAFFPRIIRKPDDRFDDTLAQVHAVMQSADQHQPWLGQVFLAEVAFSFPFAMVQWVGRRVLPQEIGHSLFPPIYANLGVIDPDQINFENPNVADIAMVGPVEYPPTRTLTINTFRGTMVLTTSFCDTPEETRRAQSLLNQYITELPQ